MKHPLKTIAGATILVALTLGPVATGSLILTADAAFAKEGNGGGNGGDRGGDRSDRGNGGRSDRGKDDTARGNAGGRGTGATNTGGGLLERIFPGAANGSKPAQPVRTASRSAVETSPTPPARPGAGRGALASELKGLNAAHASPQALANASPDSQVGRIAAYRDAILAEETARQDLELADQNLADARDALATLQSEYSGRSAADIQQELDAALAAQTVDQDAVDALEAELAEAEAHEADVAALESDIAGYETEISDLETAIAEAPQIQQDALTAAANGRTLSPEALAELHRLLGLEAPDADAGADTADAGSGETGTTATN
ncbi:hypothetical protein [Actibacterium sp. MT2.3-13A]|uniref:hypothetical protein n=1 Tax=Actibacterium sp. MT2.3-13A TaxID=2828332 RepID=UPI001BAC592C|nr:hypothetical protein [Actibacterium sp. MT2.3-13A]